MSEARDTVVFTYNSVKDRSESAYRGRGKDIDHDKNILISLTIDDQKVTVTKGTTILNAATQAGIDIPTLCYLKELLPDGSCRMCTVEVEGGRKGGLVTACTEQVAEGMIIHTHSQRVDDSRRFIIDCLLSNQTREVSEVDTADNRLLDYAKEYGVSHTSFKGMQLTGEKAELTADLIFEQARPVDDTNPFYTYDPSLCIMCRRCERVCQFLQERDIFATSRRGFDTIMLPCYGENLDLSRCESCGLCVSVCPTGALKAKDIARFNAS